MISRNWGGFWIRAGYPKGFHGVGHLGGFLQEGPRTWAGFWNWAGFPKGFRGVREDFGIGGDFQIYFNELGRILELGRITTGISKS